MSLGHIVCEPLILMNCQSKMNTNLDTGGCQESDLALLLGIQQTIGRALAKANKPYGLV